jgi:hypothetical protein
MNIKTNVKAGSCYPGYPTSYRYALINGGWQCVCTTDYNCASSMLGASDMSSAPPPPSQ